MKQRIRIFILIPFFSIISHFTFAGPGDTTVVQTFTFGSAQNDWFVFPSDSLQCEKVLMLYTLKCNPAQNPACGEWDYLTYTYLYDHTGKTDSSVVHQPFFLVNGAVSDSLPYSLTPTYTLSPSWQYYLQHLDTTTLNTYELGLASQISGYPFGSSQPISRTQMLWKASELISSGLSAGDITGLSFHVQSIGSPLKNLCIRIKSAVLDSLSEESFDPSGFTEVYRRNTNPADTGWISLQFLSAFYWDGISNIIIEITFENSVFGIDNPVFSSDVLFPFVLSKSSNDRSVGFNSGGYVFLPVSDSLQALDSVISVGFWAFGDPALQPMDGTCFEGVDASGNRVINSHLPWSNSNIYWDAGNDGGSYDRINKAATTLEIKGQWNYWTFTKNVAAGSLKIYRNGNLWHSGSGLTRLLHPIENFRIGKGNWSGAQSYKGRMDEFSIFAAELDSNTIRQYLGKEIDASHPYWNKLINYYRFDEGNFQTANDFSPDANPDALLISADNSLKGPDDYVYGFFSSSIRPDIRFEQGVFTSVTDSVMVMDSLMNIPLQVITFTDSLNNPGQPVDTFIVWPAAYYNFLYDSNGIIYDSAWVVADSVLIEDFYDYYNYFSQVIRYELARYITPYGNGLSLGNGWTWTFDVTDYRPLLSDSVHLAAGNWQELLDMKFLFIEGTPAREVQSIRNLWNGGFNYGQAGDPIENHLTPIDVYIPDTAAGARWKSRITGHGMDTPQNCAEFCPKYHYFKVDGVQQFSQLVWRDNCDLNPLFPQGGTWVYDRANWCPGAEVWTYDFELTPFISPGDSLQLDHDVQSYTNTSGWDYYQIEDQLVTYGSPNFTLNAAIVKILSPTTDKMWGRMNPICTKPALVIRNNGTDTLTSLSIQYGIKDAPQSTYYWTGNLPFLAEATVELDTFTWAQGASEFSFEISNPNGGNDQYPYNDKAVTPFTYVPVLPQTFVIALKTNNNPWENSYTLYDQEGNLIHSRSGLTANTQYSDTLTLENGCYEFRLLDSGEDGLTWWANTGQGNGSLRFRSSTMTTQVYKNFGSDFGGEIYYQFTVGLSSGIQEQGYTPEAILKVYPNPAESSVNIDYDLPKKSKGNISIYDIYGRLVSTSEFHDVFAGSLELDVSNFVKGFYVVRLETSDISLSKKLIIK